MRAAATSMISNIPRRRLRRPSSRRGGAAALGLTVLAAAARPSSSLSSSPASSPAAATASHVCNARTLGGSDLVVSEACLGTMTFGVQNDASDAFAQLDYARSRGCNFIDTAELYPVPLTAPEWRAGATEEILGEYLNKIGGAQRDELVVASKVAGYMPDSRVAAARSYPNQPIVNADGTMPDCRLDGTSVKDAVHASLRRLNTDRIDLLQLHWPDRYVPAFGMTTYQHSRKRDDEVPILETAAALKELIEEGKVRYIGLSNESTLGVCEWASACERLGIKDKLASIQNSYNLLDRRFDSELAEACDAHGLGLLPWSILAGGLLSGKYNAKSKGTGLPASSDSRYHRFDDYMSRWHPSHASRPSLDAAEEYARIAADAGMTPSELATAFVRTRRFVAEGGSVIVGATTMEQLEENLAPFVEDGGRGAEELLSDEVLRRIDEVHLRSRDPCCSL